MAPISAAIFNSQSADVSFFEAGQIANLPAIILLPGLTCSAYRLLESLLPLAEQTKLIAVDSPGHGKSVSKQSVVRVKSHASDVMQFIRTRLSGSTKVCFLAHSMGAKLLYALLDDFGEELQPNVEAVVIIDGTAPEPVRAGPMELQYERLRWNCEVIAKGKESMISTFSQMFLTGFVPSSMFSDWQKFLAECDPKVMANLYWDTLTTDFTHVVKAMKTRVLVVGGDASILPETLHKRLTAAVPPHGAHVAILPGGTHCLFYQAELADKLMSLISQLLAGTLEPNTFGSTVHEGLPPTTPAKIAQLPSNQPGTPNAMCRFRTVPSPRSMDAPRVRSLSPIKVTPRQSTTNRSISAIRLHTIGTTPRSQEAQPHSARSTETVRSRSLELPGRPVPCRDGYNSPKPGYRSLDQTPRERSSSIQQVKPKILVTTSRGGSFQAPMFTPRQREPYRLTDAGKTPGHPSQARSRSVEEQAPSPSSHQPVGEVLVTEPGEAHPVQDQCSRAHSHGCTGSTLPDQAHTPRPSRLCLQSPDDEQLHLRKPGSLPGSPARPKSPSLMKAILHQIPLSITSSPDSPPPASLSKALLNQAQSQLNDPDATGNANMLSPTTADSSGNAHLLSPTTASSVQGNTSSTSLSLQEGQPSTNKPEAQGETQTQPAAAMDLLPASPSTITLAPQDTGGRSSSPDKARNVYSAPLERSQSSTTFPTAPISSQWIAHLQAILPEAPASGSSLPPDQPNQAISPWLGSLCKQPTRSSLHSLSSDMGSTASLLGTQQRCAELPSMLRSLLHQAREKGCSTPREGSQSMVSMPSAPQHSTPGSKKFASDSDGGRFPDSDCGPLNMRESDAPLSPRKMAKVLKTPGSLVCPVSDSLSGTGTPSVRFRSPSPYPTPSVNLRSGSPIKSTRLPPSDGSQSQLAQPRAQTLPLSPAATHEVNTVIRSMSVMNPPSTTGRPQSPRHAKKASTALPVTPGQPLPRSLSKMQAPCAPGESQPIAAAPRQRTLSPVRVAGSISARSARERSVSPINANRLQGSRSNPRGILPLRNNLPGGSAGFCAAAYPVVGDTTPGEASQFQAAGITSVVRPTLSGISTPAGGPTVISARRSVPSQNLGPNQIVSPIASSAVPLPLPSLLTQGSSRAEISNPSRKPVSVRPPSRNLSFTMLEGAITARPEYLTQPQPVLQTPRSSRGPGSALCFPPDRKSVV